MNDKSVIFKGNKDGLIIQLDTELEFSLLKTAFAQKLTEAHNFIGNATMAITFQGRELSEFEERELMNIVKAQSNLRITRVDRTLKKRQEAADAVTQMLNNAAENTCLFHRSSLRNGQAVRYSGSVVVLGDVNPGGEVIAEGNVIILGALKGLVHAGCTGNINCFVSALNLTPTQLRIGDIISYIPSEIAKKNRKKSNPSLAYVEEGQIYISHL